MSEIQPIETEEGRVVLVNGAFVDIRMPRDQDEFSMWTKAIRADGQMYWGDLIVPAAMIAFFIKGESFKRLKAEQPAPIQFAPQPAPGRLN
jgi:hypothetical protein